MAKYSKGAGKRVKSAMHRKKKGTLKSGSGRKVTSRKQAIAIGLSEARKKGAKVPKIARLNQFSENLVLCDTVRKSRRIKCEKGNQ